MSNLINIKKVVDGGFCVGCGSCAYLSNTSMKINEYGEYTPQLDLMENADTTKLDFACPFLNPEQNETVIAKSLFHQDALYDEMLGYYIDTFAGHVQEDNYRQNGTSGGMTSWIVAELLKQKVVDGVVHVKENNKTDIDEPYYKYAISTTEEEIKNASKTRYHVVEMTEILDLVNKSNKKFVFIGVPCMCKSIRRLQLLDSTLKEKIPFVISLVCGHLKSINWSLSLSWGAGINPKNSSKIQYRTKGEKIPARAYVFKTTDFNDNIVQKDSAEVAGGKYNAGALMLKACEFCDDVIGETSDLTIGDAWLPKFEADDNGINLLVVRNKIIYDILVKAKNQKRITLENITVKEAISSQSGGYKQRREGLSYRLHREINKNNWVPEKRIKPSQFKITKTREKIFDARSEVTNISRELFKKALEEDNYSVYSEKIIKMTAKLRKQEIFNSLPKLLLNKAQRVLLKLLRGK
jgi:coenzyme F420 hydrogenase subunit beta